MDGEPFHRIDRLGKGNVKVEMLANIGQFFSGLPAAGGSPSLSASAEVWAVRGDAPSRTPGRSDRVLFESASAASANADAISAMLG